MTQASLPSITTRIDLNTQELLLQAASLIGISSLNAFVLNAAIEKANAILKAEENTRFNREDTERLLHYLDNPPIANEKLMKLFQAHQQVE